MKILGMLLVLTASTLIGYKLSLGFVERLKDIRSVKHLVKMLRGEIKYKVSLLEEAFRNMSNKMDKTYSDFLHNVSNDLAIGTADYEEIISNNLLFLKKNTALKDKDIEQFRRLLNNLGYLDKEMQLSAIDMYLGELEECEVEARNEQDKNGRLYKILGVFTGLFICIFTL